MPSTSASASQSAEVRDASAVQPTSLPERDTLDLMRLLLDILEKQKVRDDKQKERDEKQKERDERQKERDEMQKEKDKIQEKWEEMYKERIEIQKKWDKMLKEWVDQSDAKWKDFHSLPGQLATLRASAGSLEEQLRTTREELEELRVALETMRTDRARDREEYMKERAATAEILRKEREQRQRAHTYIAANLEMLNSCIASGDFTFISWYCL